MIFILEKFFFICQSVFHRVHDLFKELIISYFAWVIYCDSTNAKRSVYVQSDTLFLKHGGHIKCEITGGKKRSKDLEQGGLDTPARLTISNTNKKNDRCHERKIKPPR